MRSMLDGLGRTRGLGFGPVGGKIGDFGQFVDVDILFSFSLKIFVKLSGGHF